MGEAAENKILLLLKQQKREEESEANKLLTILRKRTSRLAATSAHLAAVSAEEKKAPAAQTEIFSLPGLSTLHLFGVVQEESLKRLTQLVQRPEDGWLRYFLGIHPFLALEVAGLAHLPVNEELQAYSDKIQLLLHRLLAQWRMGGAIFREDLRSEELDELLIRLTGKLKILVQQGRLQQVTTLASEGSQLTLLATLKPDSFHVVSRFLQGNKAGLFAHLAFMVEIMAQEVITNRPGQLREAIAVGEALQWFREKLLVLIHRLALRSHLGQTGWEENPRCTSLMATLCSRLQALFASGKQAALHENEIKEGDDGLL